MKDVTHHLKYVQKKVLQSLRKSQSPQENIQNGVKINLASSFMVGRPLQVKRKG